MIPRLLACAAVLAFLPLAGADSYEVSARGCATTGLLTVTPEPRCTFRCLPGDVLVVEVVGADAVQGYVSCGGVSASCSDLVRCRGESSQPAWVEAVGVCGATTRLATLRCEARPG